MTDPRHSRYNQSPKGHLRSTRANLKRRDDAVFIARRRVQQRTRKLLARLSDVDLRLFLDCLLLGTDFRQARQLARVQRWMRERQSNPR
jgi:2-keto-3-deoxy-galactonokinase